MKVPRTQVSPAGSLPTAEDVHRLLLDGIRRGDYLEKLPSESQLAQRLEASRPAVAAALNQLAAAGVVERKRGSGTYIRQRPAKTSLTFELLLPESVNREFFTPLGDALKAALEARGHRLLWPTGLAVHSVAAAANVASEFVKRGLAGAFFVPFEFSASAQEMNEEIVRGLGELPVILVDRCLYSFPKRSDFDMVGIDNRRAGYLLTDHLIRTHRSRRLAFVRRHDSASTVDARVAGFEEAVRTAGDPVRSEIFTGAPSDAGFVASILNEFKPEDIVCANDTTAAAMLQAIAKVGGHETVRVEGFDGLPSYAEMNFATIRQPFEDVGAAAVGAMIERLSNPKMPARDILVKFEFLRRCCKEGLSTPC